MLLFQMNRHLKPDGREKRKHEAAESGRVGDWTDTPVPRSLNWKEQACFCSTPVPAHFGHALLYEKSAWKEDIYIYTGDGV
jgi:hypothetical protein